MRSLRPADLAREHGLSTQAVRNYERNGCLPPADRTPTGYRIYTDVHAAALRAYVALVRGFGHASARSIMQAVHQGRTDDALAVIDAGHEQLMRDRATLSTVREAVEHIAAESDELSVGASPSAGFRSIGELAHALDLSPATVRTWERAGILDPQRDLATGYRVYANDDVRDARLAHLLRRGGYLLDQIAVVIGQIRSAGGTDELSKTVGDWQAKLTAQGIAMLKASAKLSEYLDIAADDERCGRSMTSS
ncbi:TioE family transcriptional regulator [Dermabacter sp. Marseille-Q3180]|uniref:TioE family transcriptional regulator n=1 Tax=Dermabacter sp. Marseille-Q3180 TaxID=2758090 RepID=UPI002024F60B|nr:TioE family transcriptional regulator [Dermabacter sp. Marseille-Q3180]